MRDIFIGSINFRKLVQFDTIGHVNSGSNKGSYVKFIDDTAKSRGIYMVKFPIKNGSNGYNTWLESVNDIEDYIKENQWVI